MCKSAYVYALAHKERDVMSLPIGITVEGANIMTRAFMYGYRYDTHIYRLYTQIHTLICIRYVYDIHAHISRRKFGQGVTRCHPHIIYIHIYTYIYISLYICICMYVYIYTCIY